MEGLPPWEGLRREWALAREAWRDLPDNPLWILVGRMRERQGPRLRRARRTTLAIWGLLVFAAYGIAVSSNWYFTGPPSLEDLVSLTINGFLAPLAALFLLYCTAQLALGGQQWLGRERSDAKLVQAALVDPLLGLTLLGPREIVIAGLRAYLPLALTGTGVAALAMALVVSDAAARGFSNDANGLTAILLLPVTFGGYLAGGLLGGLILLLLSICLGLNSSGTFQRTAFMFLLVLHQAGGLGLNLLRMFAGEIAHDHPEMAFAAITAGYAYVLLAALAGLGVMLGLRRASSSWLLVAPLLWVFGFFFALGLANIVMQFSGISGEPGLDFATRMGLGVAGAWTSINLFAPGNVVSLWCIGERGGGADTAIAFALQFVLTFLLLLALVGLAYRAALACAAIRLRAE